MSQHTSLQHVCSLQLMSSPSGVFCQEWQKYIDCENSCQPYTVCVLVKKRAVSVP